MTTENPFLNLTYEPALEALGDDYYDIVAAADFPQHILRFRNDDLLPRLGLQPSNVSDFDFIEAFGQFQQHSPLLALRYHGYQFGDYNAALGDGRGFLYGQVRGTDGKLYDFGTKGSGTTPYSRNGDGRLTLKGGVREILASEALHALGVNTSRCFSLVETGERLWRGDEPSPTRSSVMVRFSQSHIRFGTFERLQYLGRADLMQPLLDHVIEIYYAHLLAIQDVQARYAQFYAELVQRVAQLAAQWMSVGFCHAVLNTDNMSITGESFDYGPYAFMDEFNPRFTAAYFDYMGRYSYGNQPRVCEWNLLMLQKPLKLIMAAEDLESSLATYRSHYYAAYKQRMLAKLGFEELLPELGDELLRLTLELLQKTQVGYHDFFTGLTGQFSERWGDGPEQILQATAENSDDEAATLLEAWRLHYHTCLTTLTAAEMVQVGSCLRRTNPDIVLLRPEIEAIWEPIVAEDNWQPFDDLLAKIQKPFGDD
ncbi:YdiU family protein [Leptolyngbya cf. ectocarpi LEGE 11479]|uniref:Protein nucleotidyltransferase YdiU n=1 Tax=Leptolyngbya cf. ectocarpi LEGE 11479 TaxID=1828722 RepID=A0A928ZXP5_LEPEC|nr:YdiU family protein [Leptolyngbya ectocarpi]MBE9069355.1 YdiU family protein [Leptolyngbya cf. ectocarpi LEGE 11479]